jgi:hypothetical protein
VWIAQKQADEKTIAGITSAAILRISILLITQLLNFFGGFKKAGGG